MAARMLLANAPAPVTEATFNRVRVKFGGEDAAVETATVEAAMAASAATMSTGRETGWRQETDFDPRVAVDVVKSRNVMFSAGNGGLKFSHLQYVINTAGSKDNFRAAIGAFWRLK